MLCSKCVIRTFSIIGYEPVTYIPFPHLSLAVQVNDKLRNLQFEELTLIADIFDEVFSTVPFPMPSIVTLGLFTLIEPLILYVPSSSTILPPLDGNAAMAELICPWSAVPVHS